MEDPATIALNLTFFGTVFVALVMFLGLFIAFIAMLVLAGVGRLLALVLMALFGRLPKNDTIEVVRLPAAGQQAVGGPDAGQSGPANERPVKGPTANQPRAPRPVRAPRPAVDWKALLTRAGLREALRTAVAHHPLLTAARPVPPVLAKDWAEAVAAAERAQLQPPVAPVAAGHAVQARESHLLRHPPVQRLHLPPVPLEEVEERGLGPRGASHATESQRQRA